MRRTQDKIQILAAIFALMALTSGCTGWSEDKVAGTMTVYQDVQVKDGSKSAALQSGSAILDFDYGYYGMTDPSVSFQYSNGSKVSISIPRKSFQDLTLAASAQTLRARKCLSTAPGSSVRTAAGNA